MAIIDSLKNGVQLLELIAETGTPVSTPELIKGCDARFGMTASQVRNTIETLADQGWLQRMDAQGGKAVHGLGSKPARLWSVYVGRRIMDLQTKNREVSEELFELKNMVELGPEG